MILYFDSKTGNVRRFADKVAQQRPFWNVVNIDDGFVGAGHLVTYTAGAGQVPEKTNKFLEENSQHIKSVSVSGNRNWGARFGAAARIINEKFDIPITHVFELSGFEEDVKEVIKNLQIHEKKDENEIERQEPAYKRKI